MDGLDRKSHTQGLSDPTNRRIECFRISDVDAAALRELRLDLIGPEAVIEYIGWKAPANSFDVALTRKIGEPVEAVRGGHKCAADRQGLVVAVRSSRQSSNWRDQPCGTASGSPR